MAAKRSSSVRALTNGVDVRGQRVEVPLGEKSSLTIDRFPDHIELVALNIVFIEGTRAADYPPIDLAKWAKEADALLEVLASYEHAAKALVKVADQLEPYAAGPLSRDVGEVMRQMVARNAAMIAAKVYDGDATPDFFIDEAIAKARTRARRRVHDDAFYREVCEYRSEHGVQATATKYRTDDRQIQRWLKEARRRGMTYRGMRGG